MQTMGVTTGRNWKIIWVKLYRLDKTEWEEGSPFDAVIESANVPRRGKESRMWYNKMISCNRREFVV